MDNKRFLNHQKSKHKYNQLNNLISNHFKYLENEQKLNKLIKNISKNNSLSKNSNNQTINSNSTKKDYTNSPSFGCRKTKSVDDIIYTKKRKIKKNIPISTNSINNKIKCYKRPRHYINNKSADIIKNIDRYGYNNQNDKNEDISKIQKCQKRNKYITNYMSIKNKESANFERVNSFENIFTKIPTNISRIKKNKDSFEQSLYYSLLNNNINNTNNYF